MKTTHFALPAALLTATLALAGCSGASTSPVPSAQPVDHSVHSMPMGTSSASSAPGSSRGAYNAADVMFAQMMIPHHEQAVEMSDLVLAKSGLDSRVTKLAEQIKAAQAPEIATQRGWLTAWGQPSAMAADPGRGMDGMLTADDLAKLKAAAAPEAARLFLSQMIAHHEGAVAMAQAELSGGANPEAVAMARSIVDSQTAEIDGMKTLLGQL